MNNVEFISYDGEAPCLCYGTLVAKVNGNTYHFHYTWADKRKDPLHEGEVWCPAFWVSGGHICGDYDSGLYAEQDDWELAVAEYDKERYPEEVWDNLDRLIEMFNENVSHGCCGGCI